MRPAASKPYPNLDGVRHRVELIPADLIDESSLVGAVETARPQEVYNLAAPSFVPMSWEEPVDTAEFAAVGATALLEAVRLAAPAARVTRPLRVRFSAIRWNRRRTRARRSCR